MRLGARQLYLILLGCVLISSPIIFYFAPFTVIDYANIWFSNYRFQGWSKEGDNIFYVAAIKSHGVGEYEEINWCGNGLELNAYIKNITVMSLSEGIVMWVNDSLNTYKFPIVGESDLYFSEKLYFNVLDLKVTALKEGMKQIRVPHYNRVGLSPDGVYLFNDSTKPKSYVYLNLTEIDTFLETRGEEFYILSISMDLLYKINFPTPPFYSYRPSQIMDQKTINFGYVNVSCVDGKHTYAYVRFPYQKFSYPITLPHVQTALPLWTASITIFSTIGTLCIIISIPKFSSLRHLKKKKDFS